MMKHLSKLSAALLTAAALAAPVQAQNASEIAKAQAGKSCAGCNLFQADFSYLSMKNASFEGARLRQSDMFVSVMDGVNFSKANLSLADLFGGRFQNADFSGANLEGATLVGGWFGGANFAGANLTGANLSGAEMKTAKGLTQSQLNSACGDSATELPGELFVSQC